MREKSITIIKRKKYHETHTETQKGTFGKTLVQKSTFYPDV